MGSHSRLKIIMPDEPIANSVPEPQRISAYELRPIAQVRKIPLIEREIREHLSQAALDAVFASAEIISEGEAGTASGKTQFLGSTMLTLDMLALAELLREPADEGTARRLAALLAKDKSIEGRIECIVRREVERITHAPPQSVQLVLNAFSGALGSLFVYPDMDHLSALQFNLKVMAFARTRRELGSWHIHLPLFISNQ